MRKTYRSLRLLQLISARVQQVATHLSTMDQSNYNP